MTVDLRVKAVSRNAGCDALAREVHLHRDVVVSDRFQIATIEVLYVVIHGSRSNIKYIIY